MKWMFYFAILLAALMFVRGVLRALLAPMREPSNFKSAASLQGCCRETFPSSFVKGEGNLEIIIRCHPGPSRSRGSTVKQGTMEKDPVCGTYVDTDSALRRSFRGETKYFCSAECLEKFKQGP